MPITVLVVLVLQHNERTQWVAQLLSRERGDEREGDRADEPATASSGAVASAGPLPSDQPGASPE
jgi:hypothetical protein